MSRSLATAFRPIGGLANTEPKERQMHQVTRLALGFAAGFISVLIVSNGIIAILAASGATIPFMPWSMAAVPPFGVPQTLSAAFWGGLWGVAYALFEPKLTARIGWWAGGLVFGLLPLLALWFVALPLKGLPIGNGFMPTRVPLDILLHLGFSLGVAVFFRLCAQLLGHKTRGRETTINT